jgi:hypothetical protein
MRSRALRLSALLAFVLPLSVGADITLAAKGTDIRPSLLVLTPTVSPGNDGAFATTFTNTGPSTFTDLYLSASIAGAAFDTTRLPSVCSQVQPDDPAEVTCSLGTVASGAPAIELFFVFVAGSAGTADVVVTYSGDSRQNNPQAAKRDTWTVSDSVTIEDSENIFGRWQKEHPETEMPFERVGNSGYQTTSIAAHAANNAYRVYIEQKASRVGCDNRADIGGFGLAVEVDVNDGLTPITAEIRYTVAALEKTPTNKIDLIHENDGVCVEVVRGCPLSGPLPSAGCFDVTTEGTGKNQITIVTAHLPHNGLIKGW